MCLEDITTDLKVDGNREVRSGLRLVIPDSLTDQGNTVLLELGYAVYHRIDIQSSQAGITLIKLFEVALRHAMYPGQCSSSAMKSIKFILEGMGVNIR